MNGNEKMFEANPSGATEGSLDEVLPGDELGEEISPLVVAAVGAALQAHFRSIVALPLPDRLIVLLAELEARERSQ